MHLAVLAGFLAAGAAAGWPRATYLAGKLSATRDADAYVWGFWWVRISSRTWQPVVHPQHRRPVGAQLGPHALMPLPDALMTPVTLAFGPSASYNLLSIAMPGCSATRRTGWPGCGCRRRSARSRRAPSSGCPRCWSGAPGTN